ncbi:hypothetical protein LZP73_15835 [Shewanella sp. AS16]|uniref:hypothetical protein n=1 Tax=Shewanella sp. AS16 TaxID=2907625 RepID=UPI001F1716A9|nr:hypothetical protein [Shewanella sp. AS16]MCE9687659.1 hypothetical protein [Shewanella sp. AS16]
MSMLLLALVLLQFAGANLGAHQLHPGNAREEADNHPHLQFSVLADGKAIALAGQAANHEPGNEATAQTATQVYDLCLDCQCHGGHVTLVSAPALALSQVPLDNPNARVEAYLPPDASPSYRPPIV